MKLLTFIYGALAVTNAAVTPASAAPVNNAAFDAAVTENNIPIDTADDVQALGKKPKAVCSSRVVTCMNNGGMPHKERPAHDCWVEVCKKDPKTCGPLKECKSLGLGQV